jgi:hypothetical protein
VTTRDTIHCLACGHDVKPATLGLSETGVYERAEVHPLELRRRHFGGRARIVCERLPLPLPFAYGMRDALKAALARVNAEIAEAGGEPDVDE